LAQGKPKPPQNSRDGADRAASSALFASDYQSRPYWLDGLPDPAALSDSLPTAVDAVVVGSGYTGLNAALELARGGRNTVVLESQDPGAGCSTRNGGQISTSIKPSLAALARRYGLERARAIRSEGATALEWIETLVEREQIHCDFRRAGRYHAAHTPKQFEQLARDIQRLTREEGIEAHPVPRSEQHTELGSDLYYGGVVFPRHASLHPGKYHRGLLRAVLAAGAQVIPYCEAQSISANASGHTIATSKGPIRARDVLIATNGYTGRLTPWLRRRAIPIGSYVIATEPLPRSVVDRLFPTNRVTSDSRRVVYYYRASPDRTRVVFGGRVSATETDPDVSGPLLHAEMGRIFPELQDTRISHSWSGTVAYSFDELAHVGRYQGMHYAMCYCGSGVSMASYLGMRMGQQILGQADGRTAFDGLAFPTRPLYTGSPWFLPAVVSWYRWLDQRECARAAR